jgi:hypothetical protein
MNDAINGGFEVVGALLTWANVARLWRERCVRGVFWPVTAFFAAWGVWNLYYYPSLGQWLSFVGGVGLVVGNVAWVVLALRFGLAVKVTACFWKADGREHCLVDTLSPGKVTDWHRMLVATFPQASARLEDIEIPYPTRDTLPAPAVSEVIDG